MTGKEIIRKLMEERGMSNAELAKRTGATSATVWARLNNQSAKDMQLATFCEMLNGLGYEMVIRRRKEEDTLDNMVVEAEPAVERVERRGRPKKDGGTRG